MRARRRLLGWLALASCLMFLAGCGGASGVVKGEVNLDGQPVDGGSIAFYATTGDARASSPIEGGRYEIALDSRFPPGNYRVEISWPKNTGRKIPSLDPGILSDEKREVVPAQYNENSTLTAEVKSGENKLDYPLKAK